MARRIIPSLVYLYFLISLSSYAQESKGDRTVVYNIEIQGLKFADQKTKIENKISSMPGVNKCELDAINYTMEVVVFDKEKTIEITADDIKIVLAENNVEIKKLVRTIKK